MSCYGPTVPGWWDPSPPFLGTVFPIQVDPRLIFTLGWVAVAILVIVFA